MATKKKDDPTVTSPPPGPQYPEGTHPARPSSEADDYAGNARHEDAPGDLKPGPESVVSVEITENGK